MGFRGGGPGDRVLGGVGDLGGLGGRWGPVSSWGWGFRGWWSGGLGVVRFGVWGVVSRCHSIDRLPKPLLLH